MKEHKYYSFEIIWKSGFTHYVPVPDYKFKSQMNFNKSIEQIETVNYKEISYKEYYKMVWGEYPEEPKKAKRKKVLDK